MNNPEYDHIKRIIKECEETMERHREAAEIYRRAKDQLERVRRSVPHPGWTMDNTTDWIKNPPFYPTVWYGTAPTGINGP